MFMFFNHGLNIEFYTCIDCNLLQMQLGTKVRSLGLELDQLFWRGLIVLVMKKNYLTAKLITSKIATVFTQEMLALHVHVRMLY